MSKTQLRRVPKDGPGPKGVPECYYTSRVLNSTSRYEKFVKKLRALEEDQRRGAENKLKELKDTQTSDFFIRCDRRSLINNVARRVDLCMDSYQDDLKEKRRRLIDLYTREEEQNIRLFVVQAQAGVEAAWLEKVDRLHYLLEKRRKEHEEKYKNTPLSKCVHLHPSIYKLRAKETQDIHLYQIREKQARKLAEMEFDKMWHEVAMKEADALAARLEQDAIEKARKELECKKFSDYQLEQRTIQREKEKEMLKEEARRFKAIWDFDLEKEHDAQRQKADKSKEAAIGRKKMLEEKHERLSKEIEKEKLIDNTWNSLANQELADDKAMIELRKRKERELDECNRRMIELKKQYEDIDKCVEESIEEEAQKRQEMMDKRRCEYRSRSQLITNEEVREALIDQIKDKERVRVVLKQKVSDENEYQQQMSEQLKKIVHLKQLTEVQAKKMYKKDLLEQIEQQKLMKERAKEEEIDQLKKLKIASEEYEREVEKMMSGTIFNDEAHPFMKQISRGVRMRGKCPCSRSDYCK